MATIAYAPSTPAHIPAASGSRLQSIDALRGLVMVIMLLDHLRETWLLYMPVGDPVDARTVMPARATWGTNHGDVFGVNSLGWVWVCYLGLIVPLYFPTRWFSNLKKRRKDIWWLKYL